MNYIFFDFNGTIVDDLDLCFKLLNEMLCMKNHEKITMDKYKDIFTFPVIEYYKKAGFKFPEDNFNLLADYFVKKYIKENVNCKIFLDVIPTLKKLKQMGKHLIIISASELNMMINQLKTYGIYEYFDDVIGKDNIYAESKNQLGKDYMKKHSLNKEDCLFIGDTLHDEETADFMGIKCVLVSRGHQSKKVLSKSHSQICNNFSEIEF